MVRWNDHCSKSLSAWEIYLKILKTLCEAPLWYAKSYQRHMMTSWKPHTHMLLIVMLSFVKLLWPLWEFFSCFLDQDTRTHYYAPCYTRLRASFVTFIHSKKIKLHTMCDLTVPPSKLTSQKIHGYRNKIWTHEWPSERKQEKNLDTWRSKNIKRIIDMSSKEFTMERERIIQKGVQQIISIYISIHIHKYIHIYIYIYGNNLL
jgi:hypothetical protein